MGRRLSKVYVVVTRKFRNSLCEISRLCRISQVSLPKDFQGVGSEKGAKRVGLKTLILLHPICANTSSNFDWIMLCPDPLFPNYFSLVFLWIWSIPIFTFPCFSFLFLKWRLRDCKSHSSELTDAVRAPTATRWPLTYTYKCVGGTRNYVANLAGEASPVFRILDLLMVLCKLRTNLWNRWSERNQGVNSLRIARLKRYLAS